MKNYSSIFNLYQTKEGQDFFMLNRKIEFPSDKSLYIYDTQIVNNNIAWTVLSYQIYGTIDYWWVLAKLNSSSTFYAKERDGNLLY